MNGGGIGAHARSAPDAPAVLSPNGRLTFADLDRHQRLLAGALRDAGARAGDRIGVRSANRAELLEVTMGSLRAGIVPVTVHRGLAPTEAATVLAGAGVEMLFTDGPGETAGAHAEIVFGATTKHGCGAPNRPRSPSTL
jgi:acyl-CoA synthetase (AMP-forming)/AMP-acid ligase II